MASPTYQARTALPAARATASSAWPSAMQHRRRSKRVSSGWARRWPTRHNSRFQVSGGRADLMEPGTWDLELSLDDAFADYGAGVVHDADDDGDQPDGRAGLIPLQQVDVLDQQVADAAAADEADDRGHPHVDVPAIEREGDEL